MNNIAPAIEISRLSFWYDSARIILDDVNLAVMENELTVIIGQNGSGKTTLLKNICGLLRPSRGNIALRGHDMVHDSVHDVVHTSLAERADEIGFVMQDPDRQLFESTVYDEVAFPLKRRYAGEQIREKVEWALSLVDMTDKRDVFPPALGRADRVKTVFASILAMGPRIIMLDEPVAGQDKRGSRLIMDILSNLHRQGYTIIMVTHNINLAAEYARRFIVMKNGRVFMDGTPESVLGRADELAEAGILPPPITRLSQSLRFRLPLEKDALTPAELAAMLRY